MTDYSGHVFEGTVAQSDSRIGRQRFWLGLVIISVVYIGAGYGLLLALTPGVLSTVIKPVVESGDVSLAVPALIRAFKTLAWVCVILYLIFAVPFGLLFLKRQHDRGRNGLDVLAYIVLHAALLLLQASGLAYIIMPNGIMQLQALGPLFTLTPIGSLVVPASALPLVPMWLLTAMELAMIAFGVYLLVVLGFLKGTEGPNRFGPDPLGGTGVAPRATGAVPTGSGRTEYAPATGVATNLDYFGSRIGRKQFWFGAAVLVIASGLISLLVSFVRGFFDRGGATRGQMRFELSWIWELGAYVRPSWTDLVLFLAFAYPWGFLSVMRRHDADSRGWDVLVYMALSGALLLVQVLGPTYITTVFGVTTIPNGMLPGIPLHILTVLQVALLAYLAYLLVMLAVLKGTRGPNRFGPDPLADARPTASGGGAVGHLPERA
jgi:uncharacterized membrane protein YhaH (DUF805 family)